MADERYFTVEEADAELPVLRERLDRIRGARDTVLRAAEVVRRASPTDGGGAEGAAYLEATRVLRQEVEALAAAGIILRDPDSGLVDFPSRREGRTVYLCWRLGEDRVAHWHDANAGFAGRRPL
ncbi:MAG TPA: DUF2203 domain-containing protein [Actinomycetota bacterium]|nr:DUF2203 domain-containing protein [Actinomycetota bacterium]